MILQVKIGLLLMEIGLANLLFFLQLLLAENGRIAAKRSEFGNLMLGFFDAAKNTDKIT